MKIYKTEIKYSLVKEDVSVLGDSPKHIYEAVKEQFEEDPTVEWFLVVSLNRKNKIMEITVVTKGTATASLVHPREVLKPVILSGASAFVCAHNHPSGDPSPSQADRKITRSLREAAKIMQLDFLDHIICGEKSEDPQNVGYYSFNEAGYL